MFPVGGKVGLEPKLFTPPEYINGDPVDADLR